MHRALFAHRLERWNSGGGASQNVAQSKGRHRGLAERKAVPKRRRGRTLLQGWHPAHTGGWVFLKCKTKEESTKAASAPWLSFCASLTGGMDERMICLVWSAALRTLLGHGHSEAAPKQLSRHSKKEQAVLVETNIKLTTLCP